MADQFGCDLFMNEQNNETDFHDDDDPECEEEPSAEETHELVLHNNLMLRTLIDHFKLEKKVNSLIDETLKELEERDQTLQ